MSLFKANYGFNLEVIRAPLLRELSLIATIVVNKLEEL